MFEVIVDARHTIHDTRRTPDIQRSEKFPMSTLCSGELKMLHNKYLSSRVCSLFLSFPYISLCKTCDSRGEANFNPKTMI